MKTMTCKQLGGACNHAFQATSFDEIAALSKAHATEMVQQQDAAHLEAMQAMQQLMQQPGGVTAWMEQKRQEFEALPEE